MAVFQYLRQGSLLNAVPSHFTESGPSARQILNAAAPDIPSGVINTASSGEGAGRKRMTTGRLEAFSDGVIAIIITIMVLEMKVPHGDRWQDLLPLIPTFLCYILSFVYVGIYWNNHHHMLHACTVVTGAMLWANLHLLFWLSLFPFATGWMGENH